MRATVFTLASVLIARGASANPVETFGTDPRSTGMGRATVALGDPRFAGFANAAAGAAAEAMTIGIGYGYGSLNLRLSDEDLDLMDAHGTTVSAVVPFDALGGAVHAALVASLYMPDQFIALVSVVPATQPRFVLWDHRPHRVVFDPALALRLRALPWISLGAGMTILADGAGNGVNFRVGLRGGQAQAESNLDVELPTRAAPTFGVLLEPFEGLRLGGRYRGEISLDVYLDVVAGVEVPGTPITGDTIISIRGVDYFTPQQATGGIAWDPGEDWTLATDVVWADWSAMPSVAGDVAILVNIGFEPALLRAAFPDPAFRDTVSPRLGVERRLGMGAASELALRGGWSYEPSPVPEQTGITSFADSARQVPSLGAGFAVTDWLPGRWSLDVGLALHALARRETRKDDRVLPNGDFTSEGEVWFGSAAITWEERP